MFQISTHNKSSPPRKTNCVDTLFQNPLGHVDFVGPINGQHYLIVIDAYSKWLEVFPTNHTTGETIIKIQQVFSRFGRSDILILSSGNTFTFAEFSTFCQQNSIQQIQLPTFHPQSNGQVENFVDTFKRKLLKLKGEETSLYQATPNQNVPDRSPLAKALMNWKICLNLPIDIICPVPQYFLKKNTVIENQFNQKHVTVQNVQSVLTKGYHIDVKNWVQVHIMYHTGYTTYDGSDMHINYTIHAF